MNMGQDRQMQMVGGNGGNQFRQYARQNVGNLNGYNTVQNIRIQVVQNEVQNPSVKNVGNQNGLNVVPGTANQNANQNGNGNVVETRDEENAVVWDIDEIKEVNSNCILMANLQQVSTSGTQTDKAPFHDSNGSAESREELYFSNTSKTASVSKSVSKSISIPNEEFLDDTSPTIAQKFLNEVKSTIVTLKHVVKQNMTLDIHNWSSTAHQELQKIIKDEIFPIVNQVNARVQNFKIQFLKEAAKFVRDFKYLATKADESLAKHKSLEYEIERLLRVVFSQDIMLIVQSDSIVDTSNLQTELDRRKEKLVTWIIKKEKAYVVLWNNWYKKCEKCKYDKIHMIKLTKVIPKVGESNSLLKPVTSNSAPFTRESKVVKNDNVIALRIFRINPSKTSRVDNVMPNKPIKARVESTAKTRRPPLRSNTKNDRVPSTSNCSSIKNKDVELVIQNDKSEVVYAMCKQCLITANHDVCVLNYVNGINSRDDNQSANVSIVANQKKHKPKVKKPKTLGSKERFALPKPSKPRTCLRWSPTRIIFDLKGKIVASSELECQSESSKSDNAYSGCSKHMTGNLKLLINFVWKFLGTVRFGNDHIAAILGYGDL
ncbi:hypothetical protein Tco_0777458 [Tanacetum coccineum]